MRIATFLAASTALFAIAPHAIAQDATLEVFGRAMLDHTFASADEADENYSTTEARRLRIGVKGNVGSNVKYKMELNTDSSGDINAEDAYIQWAPTGGKWSLIVGQDNTHNSFHEISSSRFLPIAERAAYTDAFGFDRRLGVSVVTKGSNWGAAAGVHTVNLENTGDQSGWASSARVYGTPVNSEDMTVHVGAHWRYRDQGESDSDLRYRQRPLTHGLSRIVSTGNIADSDTLYGLEGYAMIDDAKYWVGGEYVITNADGETEDYTFTGGMIEAGTMLGGRRTYKDGVWKRPEVDSPIGDGGYGAVLLVARYDTLDLQDEDVNGGKLDTIALAADWYLTKYTHIGVTAFNSSADLGTVTSGLGGDFANLVNNGVTDEDVSGVVIRAQFDFGAKIN